MNDLINRIISCLLIEGCGNSNQEQQVELLDLHELSELSKVVVLRRGSE